MLDSENIACFDITRESRFERPSQRLEEAAADMRAATGAEVTAVAGDITTETGRAAALAAFTNSSIRAGGSCARHFPAGPDL